MLSDCPVRIGGCLSQGKRLRALLLATVAALLTANVIAAPPKSTPVAPAPRPTEAEIAQIEDRWLNAALPCNVPENKLGLYKACLRVYVSRLPKLDPAKREHFGEKYDPDRYYDCRANKGSNITGECHVYKLRRVESPEHWPFHKASPMKWPDAPAKPVYQVGMGPIDYWRALCKAEAGEFITRTVEKVDGLFLIRRRTPEMEGARGDRFVMEDPYGYVNAETGTYDNVPGMWTGPIETSSKGLPRFRYLETTPLINDIQPTSAKYFDSSLFQPRPEGGRYQRFSRPVLGQKAVKLEYARSVNAKYGVTWRGIKRPRDRDVGVAGGELAVVDLATGEILGLRRGFVLGARNLGERVGWGSPNACPEYSLMPGVGERRRRNKDIDFSVWFIAKVIVPEHIVKD